MAIRTENESTPDVFKLPNQLTVLRLVLSVVMFVLIAYQYFLFGMVLFIIAASTDWLDGYFARKYGQITVLGRILDPFADKVIICGTFIFLVAYPESGVSAWMAVVVVARELLVTALRSFLEQQGADFSAKTSGKLKMVLQCVAAALSLFYLHYAARHEAYWLQQLLWVTVWAAVVATVLSGLVYVRSAIRLIGR